MFQIDCDLFTRTAYCVESESNVLDDCLDLLSSVVVIIRDYYVACDPSASIFVCVYQVPIDSQTKFIRPPCE